MLHPVLNKAIDALTKEGMLSFVIIFLVIYCGLGFLMKGGLFFYSQLIGFIGIYFCVAYFKKYLSVTMKNIKVAYGFLIAGVVGWLGSMLLTNLLGLKIQRLSDQLMRWNIFINPFFILISVGLFYIFKERNFYNKKINYVASLTLLIYIIHCNRIVRDYLRFDIFGYILNEYTYDNLLAWVIVYSVVSMVLGTFLAILYNESLGRLIRKWSCRFSAWFISIFEKFVDVIMKFE